jgi:hypothetical protein
VQELARCEAVIFTIHPDADELREVNCTDRVSLCHEVTIRRQTPAQQPPPALDTSVVASSSYRHLVVFTLDATRVVDVVPMVHEMHSVESHGMHSDILQPPFYYLATSAVP